MNRFQPLTASRLALLLVGGVLALGLAWPRAGTAQDKPADPARHKHGDAAAADKGLADQVRELQAKITKLEAALKQTHPGTPPGPAGMGGKGGMMGMGGMGGGMMGGPGGMMGMGGKGGMMGGGMEAMKPDEMMGQMMQKMGQMMQMMGEMQGKGTGGGRGMMGMDKMMGGMGGGMAGMGGKGMEDDDMAMMGMMGTGKMQRAAALPGFPGASHIYHIGATGFFLDHPEHVTLTTEQQTALNALKEKALLDKSSSQRKIDEAEQALWTLTASDQPDAAKIEAKVKEIEKLRGDQRLAFIRAVGEAAKVLTGEQRQQLLGQAAAKPDKHGSH
jgi:hypothetical protein